MSANQLGARGLTLIEVLIALAISSLMIVGVSMMIGKPMEIVEDLARESTDAPLTELKTRTLAERLSSTFVMRRGYFTCNPGAAGFAIRELLESTLAFSGRGFDLPRTFSIAFSNHSSLITQELAGTDLAVTDATKFAAGALVLLTSINSPTTGGVFQVGTVDLDTGRISLNPFPRTASPGDTLPSSIPAAFNCTIQNSTALNTLLAAEENRVFGRQSQTLRVDVLQLATYEPRPGQIADSEDLHERVWPVAGAPDFTSEGPAIIGSSRIAVGAGRWILTGGSATNGNFAAELILGRRRTQIGNRQNLVERSLRRGIGYSNASSSQVNFGGVTIPSAAGLTFPTCAVTVSAMNDFLSMSDSEFARLYVVRPVIGGNAIAAGISVTMLDPTSVGIPCWRAIQIQDSGGRFVLPAGEPGSNGILELNPTTPGLGAGYCTVPHNSTVQAEMRFLDNVTNAVVKVSCPVSGVPTGIAPTYEYDGTASSCTEEGQINFGTLVEVGTSAPRPRGPTLFVDGDSCEWSSGGGVWTDCTPTPSRGDLENVRLRPNNIPGMGAVIAINCT